jgi:hypothetical protein
VEIPPSDTIVEIPAAVTTTAISNTTTKPVAAPAAVHQGVRTAPKIGKGFPNTEDFYPAASKRLNEEGSPTVHDRRQRQSSPRANHCAKPGSTRLDDGALALVKAAPEDRPGTGPRRSMPVLTSASSSK